MLRRTLSIFAALALAGAVALVPAPASAVDQVNVDYVTPTGVTFSSADTATVPITYTCWNSDDHVSTGSLHVRVDQFGPVAEGYAPITCDHAQREVTAEIVNGSNRPFENGTASVYLTIGSDFQQGFDDVPLTGVPELPKNAQLEVQDATVQFSSATDATVGVSYTCGAAGSPRGDHLHVSAWQPRSTAYEAVASNPGDVPVVCDGSARSTSQVDLVVQEGKFVNGSGAPNAEAWLSLDGESNVATQDVQVLGVPQADDRAEVAITVNASPEPATKGKKITIKGTIERNGKAYAKKRVALEFRPEGETYEAVKTVTASSRGKLSTSVTASRSGSFRWTSSETGSTKAGVSGGDHVEVKAAPKPKPKPKSYANCTALHKVYPHGVGKKGAKDKTKGTPVRTFTVDSKTYAKNKKSDADKDGIACERA